MRLVALLLAVMTLALAGCDSPLPLTTAGLSDPAISTAVDLSTRAPLEKATIFAADTKTLYATVRTKNVPADAGVKAVFYYLEGSRQQIAENTAKAEGGEYLSYAFNPPESGWPIGRYEVEFVLDDETRAKVGFSIVPAADMPATKGFPAPPGQQSPPAQAAPPAPPQDQAEALPPAAQPEGEVPSAPTPAPAAPQQEEQATPPSQPGLTYKTFRDKQFGFSFELPETWTFQTVGANSDYLFSGQPGTPEAEISVIVRVVDTERGAVGSLKDQMLTLLNQYSRMGGARIESKSQIQVAGQVAPFFLVTYPAEDSKKQQVTFGHTQMGIDHSPYLLLISYSAPRQIYQENVAIFQHMVESLKLMAPVR